MNLKFQSSKENKILEIEFIILNNESFYTFRNLSGLLNILFQKPISKKIYFWIINKIILIMTTTLHLINKIIICFLN